MQRTKPVEDWVKMVSTLTNPKSLNTILKQDDQIKDAISMSSMAIAAEVLHAISHRGTDVRMPAPVRYLVSKKVSNRIGHFPKVADNLLLYVDQLAPTAHARVETDCEMAKYDIRQAEGDEQKGMAAMRTWAESVQQSITKKSPLSAADAFALTNLAISRSMIRDAQEVLGLKVILRRPKVSQRLRQPVMVDSVFG